MQPSPCALNCIVFSGAPSRQEPTRGSSRAAVFLARASMALSIRTCFTPSSGSTAQRRQATSPPESETMRSNRTRAARPSGERHSNSRVSVPSFIESTRR